MNNITEIVGLVANVCVLIMTAYTLHLTVFAQRLKIEKFGEKYNQFQGEQAFICLQNCSLRPVAINKIFVMKMCGGKMCKIVLCNFDVPHIVEPWHIAVLESGWISYVDGLESIGDVWDDSVIGIDVCGKTLWMRAKGKASIKMAKKHYKEHDFEILSVIHKNVREMNLSKNVKFVAYIKNKKQAKEPFTIVHVLNNGIMDYCICGYNALELEGDETAKDVKRILHENFGIKKKNIVVDEVTWE